MRPSIDNLEQAAVAQQGRVLRLLAVADQCASLAEEAIKQRLTYLRYLDALLGLHGTGDNRFRECRIVILNHRKTILESLSQVRDLGPLGRQLKAFADSHRKQWFFDFPRGWDEEKFWTLYVLQERTSRYTGTLRGLDRGNGTIKCVEFFQNLGDAGTMCINFCEGLYTL